MTELNTSETASMDASQRTGYPISSSIISALSVVLDSIVILGCGVGLYFALINVNADTLGEYSTAIVAAWLTIILLLQFSGMYQFRQILHPGRNIDRIVIAFFTGFFFMLAAGFALKITESYSRIWAVSFAAGTIGADLIVRALFSRIVQGLAQRSLFIRNVVIVGEPAQASRLIERFGELKSEFTNLSGVFLSDPSSDQIGGYPVRGTIESAAAFVRKNRIDDVVIAVPWSDEEKILGLVAKYRELPVNVYLGSDLVGLRLDYKEPPGHFVGAPIHAVIGRPMSGWAIAIKTIEDYALGAIFLAIAAIPMALIALAVRLDSPGPILFKQKRLGFNNEVFWIYKFRSMRHEDKTSAKTVQAKKDDDRFTRLGKWLRRTSLDELPQLLNVLNGSMSLIGPRPHAVDHNEEFAERIHGYFARHRVKPGLTGWAQVNGLRGETDTPEKMEARVRHDIYYTENWSLMFDFRIIIQTVLVLVTGKNAH